MDGQQSAPDSPEKLVYKFIKGFQEPFFSVGTEHKAFLDEELAMVFRGRIYARKNSLDCYLSHV